MSVENISKELVDELSELLRVRVGDSEVDDNYPKALKLSLSAFNSYPSQTYYSLADIEFCRYFADMLVEYAAYVCLSSEALKTGSEDPFSAETYLRQAEYAHNVWETRVHEIKGSASFHDNWVKEDE